MSARAKTKSKRRKPAPKAQRAAGRRLTRQSKKPARGGRAKPDALSRAPAASLPRFVPPCLATLVDKAPESARFEHEIKFDGYRLQARLDRGKVTLLTRKGLDWTHKFSAVAAAVGKLNARTALIDGELVSEDEGGVSRFSQLQQDLTSGRQDRMVLYAFDLLHLDGRNLMPLPLSERKAALGRLIGRKKRGALRFSESLDEQGPALWKRACKLGLEGIISKRADAPYRSGRGHDWLKAKCSDRQEFVVAGFAPSTADAHAIGALVLGVYDNNKLKYAGRVGTGYTHEIARLLFRTLKGQVRKSSPLDPVPKEERGLGGAVWVEPDMVVEVDFHGWTHGDRVRQASFQGLRADKAARDVVREVKR